MNDRTDQQLDDELRVIATASHLGHERSVVPADAAAALAVVRLRIDGGDIGDVARLTTEPPSITSRRRRFHWTIAASLTAAAAAVISIIVVRDKDPDTIVPATTPPSTAVTPVPAPTGVPASNAPDITSSPTAPTATPEQPTTPPTETVTTTNPSWPPGGEQLALPNHCSYPEPCTQLVATNDGRLVVYEPRTESIGVFDPTGQGLLFSVGLVEPLATSLPSLTYIGPDDVAYLTVDTSDNDDPVRDLVAIPLTGDRAGVIVQRHSGLDGSGDSTLVPTAEGLAVVPCCHHESLPDPTAMVYGFIDRNGEPMRSSTPTLRLEMSDIGNLMIRTEGDGTESTWQLPTALRYPRDFPEAQSTLDGGALVTDYLQFGEPTRAIVRFGPDWPEVGINNADVFFVDESLGFAPVVLEPSGTVIVSQGDRYVRYNIEQIGSSGWPGKPTIDIGTWTVSAPDLNAHITTNQPSWASKPQSLGMQLVQSVGANEQVLLEFDETSGVLTITTSGFLDDSVEAQQFNIRTERAADGLLRFVAGTVTSRCQPGRGHQDFQPQPCT